MTDTTLPIPEKLLQEGEKLMVKLKAEQDACSLCGSGRPLTKVEQDALVKRLGDRAKKEYKERTDGKGIPLVTHYCILYDGIEMREKWKREFIEAAWMEGMMMGIGVLNEFKKEIRSEE